MERVQGEYYNGCCIALIFYDLDGFFPSLSCPSVLHFSISPCSYYWSNGYYREPGNSGYAIDNPDMEKHLVSCLDRETGVPEDCLLASGAKYISCQDGLGDATGVCERMELCPNQPYCKALTSATEQEICQANLIWCRQYTI
jgi:hypothetical protein